MEESKTVQEIADIFDVSVTAVRNWMKDGLTYGMRKEIGKKECAVIMKSDVYAHFGIEEPK